MNKSIDFIILYEHIAREMETAALLSAELKRRGYSVDIAEVGSLRKRKKYGVVLLPYLYNTSNLFPVLHMARNDVRKIINLQYEQVYSQKLENEKKLHPSGLAQKAQHIVWGEATEKRLEKFGVSKENIHLTGHIGMDLNYPQFDKVFMTRKEISREFSLNENKKWHLFISSFSYCNMSSAQKKRLSGMIGQTDEIIKIQEESKKTILQWFENYLINNKDTYIIYRPHPAEETDNKLAILEKNFSNFKVIKSYSIRQWIKVCDSISNWFSTSIADIYFANKKCAVLRPVKMPRELDNIILDNEKSFIVTEHDFKVYMEKDITEFPATTAVIEAYYGKWNDGKCYIRLADLCEKVLKDDKYSYDYARDINISAYKRIKVWLYQVLVNLSAYLRVWRLLPGKHRAAFRSKYIEQRNYKEIFEKYEKVFEQII